MYSLSLGWPESQAEIAHIYLLLLHWEICMQVKKQQLELDMEQQTGSK